MIKSIVMLSICINLLFPFSNTKKIEKQPIANNNESCTSKDSIVNITNATNLINASGVIIYQQKNKIYVATSYQNYNQHYNYEIIFNDYSRYKATIKGVSKEDEVLLLEVETNQNYCVAKLSNSKFIDQGEIVDIFGNYNYQLIYATTHINAIGVCKNCNEETYKYYYYTLLTIDIPDYFNGAGVFDKSGQLLGMITNKVDNYNYGVSMLDINKLYAITYNLIKYEKYEKNYIKYNLLNVYSLTNYEKYLYSLDEELASGVLVSSIHYLNYIFGGLNQGMVILKVNGVDIKNMYELDNELARYEDGSTIKLTVRKITGREKTYKIKLWKGYLDEKVF